MTGYGDRSWIPVANQGAGDYVRAHPDSAVIADWSTAIGAHTEMLTSDGIHPTTDGMALYADVVKNTIAELDGDGGDRILTAVGSATCPDRTV